MYKLVQPIKSSSSHSVKSLGTAVKEMLPCTSAVAYHRRATRRWLITGRSLSHPRQSRLGRLWCGLQSAGYPTEAPTGRSQTDRPGQAQSPADHRGPSCLAIKRSPSWLGWSSARCLISFCRSCRPHRPLTLMPVRHGSSYLSRFLSCFSF